MIREKKQRLKLSLSETEREVVEYIWDHSGEVRTSDIYSYFRKSRVQWARQTLNTLLIRIEEKGLIEREHRGVVVAKYTRQQYDQLCCQEFIQNKFNGSITDMIKSYYLNEPIPDEEAEELINVIKNSIRK